MRCIYCKTDTKVANSRAKKTGNQTWRRRHCLGCGAIFTTLETPKLEQTLAVAGKDNTLVSFNRDKLFISIYKSLEHRPKAHTEAGHLTDTVIANICSMAPKAVVDKASVASAALEVLKRFDKAAYTHYLAYHPG